MSKNVDKYIELRDKWSDAFADGNDAEYERLCDLGDKLEAGFTYDDWKELISKTDDKIAKAYYQKKIKK